MYSIEKATKYYGDVLGLRMSKERTADEVYDDETGYRILYVGDVAVADVMDADSEYRKDVPKGWTLYIQVPNLDESLARAVELGGTVIHDPIETPWGRWAIFTDPTGADVAIIEHGEHHLPT